MKAYVVFTDGVFPTVNWIAILLDAGSLYFIFKFFKEDSKESREGLLRTA